MLRLDELAGAAVPLDLLPVSRRAEAVVERAEKPPGPMMLSLIRKNPTSPPSAFGFGVVKLKWLTPTIR